MAEVEEGLQVILLILKQAGNGKKADIYFVEYWTSRRREEKLSCFLLSC